jgi:hypothetical protein
MNKNINRNRSSSTATFTGLLCITLLAALPLTASAAFKEVGSAQMIRGSVTAELTEQETRTLEKTSPIYETDQIKTGPKSFAVIKLLDGTRITIRPDSQLGIKKYTFEEGKEEAEYNLVKGGMRALTGLMGKKNPDAIKVKTAYATMGIRGTSYDVRLCDADCVAEQQQKSGVKTLSSLVVGRTANLEGTVTATDQEGNSRRLSDGGPIYSGDLLTTESGASTLLVFRDNTRLAMMSGSELALNDYSYDAESKSSNRFDAELVRGDLQVKVGEIGQSNPQAFSVQTAKNVIGAQGTAYTVEDDNVDTEDLFSVKEHDFAKPGAYVTVYDGHVRVSKPENSVDASQAMQE